MMMRFMVLKQRSVRAWAVAASLVVVLAGLNGMATAGNGADQLAGPDMVGGYASTHVMVKMAPGAGMESAADGSILLPIEIREILRPWNILDVRSSFGATALNPEAAQAVGLDRWIRIEVPRGTDTLALADQLNQLHTVVEIAEIAGIGTTAEVPNDRYFDLQYGLHNLGQYINGQPGINDADIDAVQTWDYWKGDGSMTVAVIDSGVDPHAEYQSRLLTGWNTVENNTNTSDDCPHGTHVAGIIGALGNNGEGVAGVNWNVNILPVRVLTGCNGTTDQCADGIIWAVDHGANIGSMSLQYYSFSQYFEDAAQYAEANNVLLIAANGNGRGHTIAWPAKFDTVMAVAATNNLDERASFSNYGPECEISAPGQDIYSTWIDGGYTYASGTSMATPMVSGLASLVWSYRPSLTAAEVRSRLNRTVDDLGAPGRDEEFGYGRINAMAALQSVGGGPRSFILQTTPLIGGQNATLSVSSADSGVTVYFIYSLRGLGEEYIEQLGIALDLDRPTLGGTDTADNSGNASLTTRIPNAAIGRTIWLQSAQSGGKSNVVERVVQ